MNLLFDCLFSISVVRLIDRLDAVFCRKPQYPQWTVLSYHTFSVTVRIWKEKHIDNQSQVTDHNEWQKTKKLTT